MKRNVKLNRSMVEKEKNRLSKKKQKEINNSKRVMNACKTSTLVFADKRFEKTRPNITKMYRDGKFE